MEIQIQVLLLLLCCGTLLISGNSYIICIGNNTTNCQGFNYNASSAKLLDLQHILKNRGGAKNITVLLTAGIHYLNSTLSVPPSILNIDIYGSNRSNRNSVIKCNGSGGIIFKISSIVQRTPNNMKVFDLVLDNCTTISKSEKKPAALTLVRLTSFYISNVTIVNSPNAGLFSERCGNQSILMSNFERNHDGHIKIYFTKTHRKINSFINISHALFQTSFRNPSIHVTMGNKVNMSLHISNCTFVNQSSEEVSIQRLNSTSICWNHTVTITDSHFLGCGDYGIKIITRLSDNDFKIIVARTLFMNYTKSAIYLRNIRNITINKCTLNDNRIGVRIIKSACETNVVGHQEIVDTVFSGNSKAIEVDLHVRNHKSVLNNCTIRRSNITKYHSDDDKAAVSLKGCCIDGSLHSAFINGTRFEENYNTDVSCSVLETDLTSVSINNSFFTYNNCTGIFLRGSSLNILGTLTMTGNLGNFGGGLRLMNLNMVMASQITLEQNARLELRNNSATVYGGGIYIDQHCDEITMCFLQYYYNHDPGQQPSQYAIVLSGNKAQIAGDSIFGGCLQQCFLNDADIINVTDPSNIFWNITDVISDIRHSKSASQFADPPTRVAFCSNITNKIYPSTCEAYHNISVRRGEQFQIDLMIVDNSCFASTGVIEAELSETTSQLRKGVSLNECGRYTYAGRFCKPYSYILKAPPSVQTSTLQFYVSGVTPTETKMNQLHVTFEDCTPGFILHPDDDECVCTDGLKTTGIECHSNNFTFSVPAMVWMGEIDNNTVFHKFCSRCHTTGIRNFRDVNDSDSLCQPHRIGILCGGCDKNTSLKLGGYSCGFCSNIAYRGLSLVLAFGVGGLLLGLILLKLNFTVSTGLISGLIFYSNVVYSNSDDYLKTSHDSNQTRLDNAVRFLYLFQAWINLDFGIDICFFEGYNLYIATWMQFIFPLYLWLIIIVIVVISKYSMRVSKFTGNNTIPALATMFLLSYTKLSTATIAASSFTKLTYLNSSSPRLLLWTEDPNIKYLQGKHVPLFMASVSLLIFFLLPFSLLLIFGPLFQSYSQYRVFSFVNKLKPLLDSYYGPYNDQFRYWPGLLLLSRVVLLNIFAFYSLGDGIFELAAVVILIVFLFMSLWLMGKRKDFALYKYAMPNILEMFFLFNLLMYSIFTLYFSHHNPTSIHKQQITTCAFAGSAFVVSCCVLIYHVTLTFILRVFPEKIKIKYSKLIQKLVPQNKVVQRSDSHEMKEANLSESEFTPTYIELREPLIQN